LAKNQTNVVSGSPNQLSKLCRECTGDTALKIPSAIITGGKPNPYLMEMYLKRFDVVRNAYGSTEAGLMSSKLLTSTVSDTSAGFPPKEAVVEIVDSADLQLPNETEGIVRLRTPGMVRSYIGDAKATAEAFRDGWFYPGDTGMFDESSALHITGRVNDQFNFGGIKINAVAIDEVMQAVSGVNDAICFAQSTPDMIGELNAIIVLAPNGDKTKTVSDIRAAIRDKYGPSRVPTKIFVCPAAPRNDGGKAQRHLAADAVKDLEPVF
jgi:acyl-coenzyme A synthetase/AMP-(fatty) acid ligase